MIAYRQKLKLSVVAIAVSMGLAGTIVGCNDNNSTSQVQDEEAQFRAKAEAMVKDLSLSEKLDILQGPGMDLNTYAGIPPINLEEGKDVPGIAGYINGVKNEVLDIPAAKLSDGPAGLRFSPTREGQSGTFYATAWPIGSLLASSWDTDLVKKVGEAFGDEVKEYGVDFLLAPGMNIQRNPLLGRNFEYYSEDPVVSGKIAAAMVNGVESNGVGATIKHFVANNAETNRFFNDSIAEPRTLREIYLRSFQIAVEDSQPWAVMSSYNLLNGTYVDQRKDVLTDILRDEWKFKGLVMSDWFAGNVAGLTSDFTGDVGRDPESAAKQIAAGNNLIEPGNVKEDLQASYENGTLTEEDIDKSVVAILTQVQKSPSYNHYQYSESPDLNAHIALSRLAASESMVLLKNMESALPIAADKKVATFGTTQINTFKGGTGSGDVNSAYVKDIASGLAEQFDVNDGLVSFFSDYWDQNKVSNPALFASGYVIEEPSVAAVPALQELIASSAESDDAAIITIGRQAGEGSDRSSGKGDYLLSDTEQEMITAVAAAFHAKGKKVTVVLNVNGVIDTAAWSDSVDAILLAYMGGQETGSAVADVLSGAVNPSGKLAQTMPASYSDVPSSTTFPGTDVDGDGLPDKSYYNEGIYVGYRYYTSFNKPVSYAFGHGLSYTTFAYGNSAVTSNTLTAGGNLTIMTTITNTGSVAGKEAAQVYVNAPENKLKKPTVELKAFDKTALLAAGESEVLTFNISAQTLSSFDPANNEWIIEPGTYNVYVAPSSDVSDIQPITFSISNEIVVSKTTPNTLALPDGVTAGSFVTVSE
ncbi:beta-glucosidase [Aeromonas sp. sif0611]|uniref:beta-glucosidase family protein n=1 Tax=Aeromonas sp. sif0611 TaxID=2854787 RepID=UPI001C44112A|nr:glycoside hydrolase family 3 C-terminal domain-containing protein [Aeromonas sp. sif0611]MBV7469111.1 glycoside hydrolase family 3 C-terminal domain-containing protein [Aeromonas sp. sif0611]